MSPVRRLGRWLRGPEFADVVLLTVGLRLVLLLWAPIAVTVFGSELARSRDFLEIWNNWDSPHYLAIARGWYDPARDPAEIAFMPLLPVIIRVLSEFMAPLVAGMVVSLVMTIAAGLAIYRLALLDADRTVARAAVLALNVFPTSFAFVPPYTEPLFLGLAAWAFLRARRDDWIGASMLGMLASLARIQGLLLVPALIVEYVIRRQRLGVELVLLGFIFVGPLLYLAINWMEYGDPVAFLAVQRDHFGHQLASPLTVLGDLLGGLTGSPPNAYWVSVYVAPLAAFGVLGLVTMWSVVSSRSRPSYAVYTGLTFLTLLTVTWPISVPRYLLGIFPLFIALGGLARRPSLGFPALVGSLILQGALTTSFVLGYWSF